MDVAGFEKPRPAQLRRFGRVFYGAGLRMQKALADYVREGGRPDQLVMLEHDPVFTLGRNATRGDILVTPEFLESQGVSVHEIDRGGEVTYHGPGQIVVYPICNLSGGREDVGRLVRGLEEAMIRTAADFGVKASRLKGAPGIWVDTPRGLEKLGAVGLHLSRWITTHGIAFNVDPFLPHFQWIVPCGFTDKGVCSLRSLLGEDSPNLETAMNHLQRHLCEVLALDLAPTLTPSRSVSALTWRMGEAGPEVLMMLRQPHHGRWWSSVTGLVEPGETPEEACRRELWEETGLRLEHLNALGLSHSFWLDPSILPLPGPEPRFNTETCFHGEVAREASVTLNLEEHETHRWCSPSETLDLLKWEGHKASLLALAAQQGWSLNRAPLS